MDIKNRFKILLLIETAAIVRFENRIWISFGFAVQNDAVVFLLEPFNCVFFVQPMARPNLAGFLATECNIISWNREIPKTKSKFRIYDHLKLMLKVIDFSNLPGRPRTM